MTFCTWAVRQCNPYDTTNLKLCYLLAYFRGELFKLENTAWTVQDYRNRTGSLIEWYSAFRLDALYPEKRTMFKSKRSQVSICEYPRPWIFWLRTSASWENNTVVRTQKGGGQPKVTILMQPSTLLHSAKLTLRVLKCSSLCQPPKKPNSKASLVSEKENKKFSSRKQWSRTKEVCMLTAKETSPLPLVH